MPNTDDGHRQCDPEISGVTSSWIQDCFYFTSFFLAEAQEEAVAFSVQALAWALLPSLHIFREDFAWKEAGLGL